MSSVHEQYLLAIIQLLLVRRVHVIILYTLRQHIVSLICLRYLLCIFNAYCIGFGQIFQDIHQRNDLLYYLINIA